MIWTFDPVGRVVKREDGSNVSGIVPSRMTTKELSLVSTAPELLEACQNLVRWFGNYDTGSVTCCEIIRNAEAAIRKAVQG